MKLKRKLCINCAHVRHGYHENNPQWWECGLTVKTWKYELMLITGGVGEPIHSYRSAEEERDIGGVCGPNGNNWTAAEVNAEAPTPTEPITTKPVGVFRKLAERLKAFWRR